MSDSIQVTRKVLVKSLVTPKLREILTKELQGNLQGLLVEFERFSQHREGYVKQCREREVKPDYDVMKKLAVEEEKFKNSRAQVEAKLQEIASLADGVEYVHGTVDSTVNVSVGDNWHSIMTGVELVLDDGIVKEIRRRNIEI